MTSATPVNWDEVFRLTVKTMRQGLAVLDERANILYANDALGSLLGRHTDQLVNEPFVSFFDDSARHTIEEQIEQRHRGKQGIYELAFTNTLGHRFVGLISAAPLLDDQERLICSVAVITDITDRKQAEEEIIGHHQRLRSLSTELLLAEERERRRLATQIHDRIGHALALAKIKLERLHEMPAGTEQVELQADIIQLIDKTIEDTRSLTFEISPPILHEVGLVAALQWLAEQVTAQHDLQIEFDHSPWEYPLGNEVRILLFQIAREILFNVVKHARASRVDIQLSRESNLISLVIADNGIGFDILDVAERSGKDGGYGLLSIRERMRHIGGECGIVSSPGQGTTVTITAQLQFTLRSGEKILVPHGLEDAGAEMRTAAAEPVTVMLVDDQKLMRQGLQQILAQEPGIVVVAEASDGSQAVELAHRHTPDVVIMDIDMPVMDGIEATRTIISELPETRIIALSMYADWQYVSQMLQAGVSGYLLKDCAGEDLIRAIAAVRGNLVFLSPGITNTVVNQLVQLTARQEPVLAVLTSREREVLRLIAGGSSAKEIALDLDVSPKTVYTFRSNILRKLGLETDTDLTRYALREGLADLDD